MFNTQAPLKKYLDFLEYVNSVIFNAEEIKTTALSLKIIKT